MRLKKISSDGIQNSISHFLDNPIPKEDKRQAELEF